MTRGGAGDSTFRPQSEEQGLARRATSPAVSAASVPDSRGDRTRRQIKAAIARLAMRKDVADINLADICRATRLTTGAVYFHFRGKDEAVEEMVIEEVQALYERLLTLEAPDFDGLIAAVLEASTRYHKSRKRLAKAIQTVINSRPRAYEAWLEARRPVIGKLEAAIAAARVGAGLSEEAAPYLAHFILNSMEDISMDVFQWSNPTLSRFAETEALWNARQRALWRWAVLAPIPSAEIEI